MNHKRKRINKKGLSVWEKVKEVYSVKSKGINNEFTIGEDFNQ